MTIPMELEIFFYPEWTLYFSFTICKRKRKRSQMLSPFGWATLKTVNVLAHVMREYGWDVHGSGAGLRGVNKKETKKRPPP